MQEIRLACLVRSLDRHEPTPNGYLSPVPLRVEVRRPALPEAPRRLVQRPTLGSQHGSDLATVARKS